MPHRIMNALLTEVCVSSHRITSDNGSDPSLLKHNPRYRKTSSRAILLLRRSDTYFINRNLFILSKLTHVVVASLSSKINDT